MWTGSLLHWGRNQQAGTVTLTVSASDQGVEIHRRQYREVEVTLPRADLEKYLKALTDIEGAA